MLWHGVIPRARDRRCLFYTTLLCIVLIVAMFATASTGPDSGFCGPGMYGGAHTGQEFCFCQLAGNMACLQEPCSCSEGCKPPVSDERTVTFLNFHLAAGCPEPTALLTIPRNYYSGMNNLKAECPGGMVSLLTAMLQNGFAAYQTQVQPGSVMQCIHVEADVSVRWLHLHTFCLGGTVDGLPSASEAYCGAMNTSDAARPLAEELARQVKDPSAGNATEITV